MEQKNLGEMAEENINATSENNKKSAYVEVLNDSFVRLSILVFVLIVGYFGYSYIQKRNECLDLVRYYPATGEVVTKMENNDLKETIMGLFVTRAEAYIVDDTSNKRSKSEHYSYNGREFKTKEDAVSHCVRNREDWLWKL